MVDRRQEFDYSVDLLQTILWQYNDAENLQRLIQQKQDWYNQNQRDFWSNWFRDVFDLRTANDFGLSVWSIILDLPLVAELPPSPAGKSTWGFGTNNQNFANGNFTRLTEGSAGLTTSQKRIALRLRYYQLTTKVTVPEINRIMNAVFGNQQVYVIDNNDMTITYAFRFVPDSALSLVLERFDLLPCRHCPPM